MFIRANIKLQDRYRVLVPLGPYGSNKEEEHQSPTMSLLCSAAQLPLAIASTDLPAHACLASTESCLQEARALA